MRDFYVPRGTPYNLTPITPIQKNTENDQKPIEHFQIKCNWIIQIIEKLNLFIVPLGDYHRSYPLSNAKYFNAKLKILNLGIQSVSNHLNEFKLDKINKSNDAKIDIIQLSAQLKVFEDILIYFKEKLQTDEITSKNTCNNDRTDQYTLILNHLTEAMQLIADSRSRVIQADPEQMNKHFSINFNS